MVDFFKHLILFIIFNRLKNRQCNWNPCVCIAESCQASTYPQTYPQILWKTFLWRFWKNRAQLSRKNIKYFDHLINSQLVGVALMNQNRLCVRIEHPFFVLWWVGRLEFCCDLWARCAAWATFLCVDRAAEYGIFALTKKNAQTDVACHSRF